MMKMGYLSANLALLFVVFLAAVVEVESIPTPPAPTPASNYEYEYDNIELQSYSIVSENPNVSDEDNDDDSYDGVSVVSTTTAPKRIWNWVPFTTDLPTTTTASALYNTLSAYDKMFVNIIVASRALSAVASANGQAPITRLRTNMNLDKFEDVLEGKRVINVKLTTDGIVEVNAGNSDREEFFMILCIIAGLLVFFCSCCWCIKTCCGCNDNRSSLPTTNIAYKRMTSHPSQCSSNGPSTPSRSVFIVRTGRAQNLPAPPSYTSLVIPVTHPAK